MEGGKVHILKKKKTAGGMKDRNPEATITSSFDF